jgi:hypothetical protein
MLFAQIYYLKKKYGARVASLVAAMRAQLPPRQFAWQWLQPRLARPVRKFSRHLRPH